MSVGRRVHFWILDVVNPVTDPLTLVPAQTEPVVVDIFPCDNPGCCVSMEWGVLRCPRCGQAQSRIRPPAFVGRSLVR